MKKYAKGILIIVGLSVITIQSVCATTRIEAILADHFTVKLNNEVLDLRDVNNRKICPVVVDGTTYLPVRAIGDALGLDVQWDGGSNTVLLSSNNSDVEAMKPIDKGSDDTVYCKIDNAMRQGCEYIELYNLGSNVETDVKNIYNKLMDYNPYVGYINYMRGQNGDKLCIELDYNIRREDVKNEIIKTEDNVNKFIKDNISEKDTIIDKIYKVHNYILDNTEYLNTDEGKETCHGQVPYGMIGEGKMACGGYANTFQLMLNKLGVENMVVRGKATGRYGRSESHAWNIVKLEGKWYHIDPTWNDTIYEGKEFYPDDKLKDILRYENYTKYFLVGSDKLNDTHKWDEKEYPTIENVGIDIDEILFVDKVKDLRGDNIIINKTDLRGLISNSVAKGVKNITFITLYTDLTDDDVSNELRYGVRNTGITACRTDKIDISDRITLYNLKVGGGEVFY